MRTLLKLLLLALIIGGASYYYFFHSSISGSAESSSSSNSSGGAVATGSREPRGGMGAMSTLVKVTHASSSTIQEVVSSLGTVIPSQSVTVRSQVDGILQAILFEEGQLVKKGDVLAKIDPRTYQAALDQAKGSLAQNQAKLNNARQDLKRYQTLFKQDSIARQEVDTQQALVREYEANQKTLQAAVEQAELNLGYTSVIAPIDGRLGLRTVDVGNLITANSTDGLVVITQTQPIDVSFAIPDSYIDKVAKAFYAGQKLAVSISSKDNSRELAHGVLVSMDNQVDSTTGTVKLKARFDNQEYQLFPNQFVNAKIVLQEIMNALVLSNDAIQYNNEGAFVYVVQDDNTVKTQTIQLGVVNNGLTQILSGLNETDKVVIEGLDRLRNGAKVEIVK
ncbi:MdtA/MuxA family multidrug efflux RND transporter periplasmic adaptor subunit [Pelistega suis]|uniref:MdtA/MuxA family multidrug efflux RND transporter periplasmic adaptor subunit n=1 Tax=Pelistega suis TaxID=1631957 RepID=UPI00211CDBE6|nr:MdtA/MuxA family multidrug efflux RND transporter periplasmic adaptor subunit [Pelistega suis]MCQ9329264.1 MdtA/MuxA family multidrug efflux RND transporter periplasmic adaptor subunit [Pelistega suis]